MPEKRKRDASDVGVLVKNVKRRALHEISRGLLQSVRAECLFATLTPLLLDTVAGEEEASLPTAQTKPNTTPSNLMPTPPTKILFTANSAISLETLNTVESFVTNISTNCTIDCVHPDANIVANGNILKDASSPYIAKTVTFLQRTVPGVGEADLSIEEGIYDMAVSIDTLYEAGDDATAQIECLKGAVREGGVVAMVSWGKGAFKSVMQSCHEAVAHKGLKLSAELLSAFYSPTLKEINEIAEKSGLSVVSTTKFAGGCTITPPIGPWVEALYGPCIHEFKDDPEWIDSFTSAVKDRLVEKGMMTEEKDWELDAKTLLFVAKRGKVE